MSFYLSVTKSIFHRKTPRIFYFRGLSVYMLFNKEETHLFDVPGAMEQTPISGVIEYLKIKDITEAEILMPIFDRPLIDETFKYIADYLLENDASIGLLVEDGDFIEFNKDLLDKYGITYSDQRDFFFKSYGVKSKPTKGHIPDDRSFSTNGMPCGPEDASSELKIIKVRKPKKTEKKKEDKTGLDMDKPFADILTTLLINSGKNNVDVYTKGGITRQVFSKILCSRDSVPTKNTVICLIIGLELEYDVAKQLLTSAGYALSRSLVFDSVVMKYLRRNVFDLDIINEELESRQCALLGWKPRED